MARKRTMNYRELRADFDEDEERTDDEEGDEEEDDDDDEEGDEEEEAPAGDTEAGEEGEEGDDEDAPPKKKKKVKAKAKPKPKRTRVAKVTRMRVVWGVFNNSNQKVASYDYPQKGDAEAHAQRLTEDKKSTHFVQPMKEPIEEVKEK
jgi:chromodomain-helicase-DNA-binding protein 1